MTCYHCMELLYKRFACVITRVNLAAPADELSSDLLTATESVEHAN